MAAPELNCPWANVRCVLRFPRPDPYKTDKVGLQQFILVALKVPVPCGKSRCSAVLVQANGKKTPATALAGPRARGRRGRRGCAQRPSRGPSPRPWAPSWRRRTRAWAVWAVATLPFSPIARAFAYVACFWGVKDGHLWPLKQGMVRSNLCRCRPHIRFYRRCALLAHAPL